MKFMFILFTFLFTLTAHAHCPIEFEETNLCADITWIEAPVLNAKSHFTLNFWQKGDTEYRPVTPEFEVNIYSWMIMNNGMNHAGPKMNFEEVSQGVFEVKDARFFMHGMHGYWEIRCDLTDGQGNIFTGFQKVEFDGHNH